tara:strand:+ start:291 stop:515 length:225 start_codon:yes stop_codon:yes gene_type:complete
MVKILTEEEVLDQFDYITQDEDTVNIDEGLIHQAMVEYANQTLLAELLKLSNTGKTFEEIGSALYFKIKELKQA